MILVTFDKQQEKLYFNDKKKTFIWILNIMIPIRCICANCYETFAKLITLSEFSHSLIEMCLPRVKLKTVTLLCCVWLNA